jgi:tRNA nucleotidyltransferase (CCA-adding enzyme)
VDALQQMFTVIGFLKEEDRDFHIKTIRQVLEELIRENLNERLQSYMPGSSAVSVKKKCRLGGLGGTSAACNQGDISNLDIKPLKEGYLPNNTFWAWVSPDDQFYQVPVLNHKDFIMKRYKDRNFGWDYDRVFDFAMKDGWIRVIYEKFPNDFRAELNLNGYTKDRVFSVFKTIFYDLVKYGNNSIYLEWENPKDHITFSTRTGEGKAKLVNAMNEGGVTVNLPTSSTGSGWNSHNIVNDGEIVGEMELTDRKNQYLTLNKITIYREFRGRGFADKAMRLLIDFADKNNKIITLTPDNTWGASKERLKKWYMSYGFVPNKGRHADYQISESMYRLPKSLNEAVSTSLHDLPFKNDIEVAGGKLYSVGGAVRDEFLGKESKDLDVLITGIPFDELEKILSKYGQVNAVGKSFGILKFRPKGGEEIDIAIPRTEKPTGVGGHQGFDVTSDHALPIEKDLERRDFTINAIAKDGEGNVIDPYNGREDLKNKIIRIVNPQAFSDDSLRMLRAIQFAARFGFTIEPVTMKMIQENAGRIKEIPAERVLMEFDKIVKKGNKRIGVQLLKNTGLFQHIFGFDIKQSTIDRSPLEDVKTMGEFIFLLTHLLPNPAEYYKNSLRGDINTYKEIKALDAAYNGSQESNPVKTRAIAHNVYVLFPQTFQSAILPENIKNAAQEFLRGKYPKTLGELAVNGNDLMTLGFKGSEIGDMLKNMLLKIYADKLRNNKQELIKFAQQNKGIDVKKDIAGLQEGQVYLNLNDFVDKYDQWNAGGRFSDPSRESVTRFLEDEFPELVDDERLKNELRWKLTDREILNENVKEKLPMKGVSYTGVILDKESRKQLLKVFKAMIPEGWKIIAHHMTIRLNELNPDSKEYQDMKGSKTITLNVVDYAINDLVMAAGVTGYPSESVKPHITLAVNEEAGGKPAMSKELTDWKPLGFRFKVTGKIEEIENQLIETPQNTSRIVKRLAIFDFDGTLMNSPHPEVGKQKWSEKTGEKFPHIGWWSKPESLDLDVFDIKPFPGIYNQYQKEKSTPDTYVIILTSRIEKLRSQVEEILKRGGVHVNRLDMKNGDNDLDKGQKVLNYLKEFPNVQEINVYEDRDVELEAYNAIKNQIPKNVGFNIYFADKGNLTLTESKLLNTIKEEIQKLI